MRVETTVAAPAEAVWRILTDLDGSAEIISGIIAVERLDDGSGFDIGTRWNETRRMFGKTSTEEMEVTAIEDGRAYTVESLGRGVHYTSVMAVAPKGDGSVVSMSFDGEATSLVARIASVFGRIFEGSMRKMLDTDLDEIAAAAEAAVGEDAATTSDVSAPTG